MPLFLLLFSNKNSIDTDAAERFTDPNQALQVLNELDWASNPRLETSLEESVTDSINTGVCFNSKVSG